jgi:hypothetical protein
MYMPFITKLKQTLVQVIHFNVSMTTRPRREPSQIPAAIALVSVSVRFSAVFSSGTMAEVLLDEGEKQKNGKTFAVVGRDNLVAGFRPTQRAWPIDTAMRQTCSRIIPLSTRHKASEVWFTCKACRYQCTFALCTHVPLVSTCKEKAVQS